MFNTIGEMMLLLLEFFRTLPRAWRERQKIYEQLFEIGNASLRMACILSVFIGGVIALQTGPVLVERGLASAIGGLVGLSMCKELAPVMMSVLIAGRVGSAMTAEIGSMRVYQEIDALRTMNINPVQYLVMPRMIAISIALPTLVVFAVLVGWMGGALVSVYNDSIAITFEAASATTEEGDASAPGAMRAGETRVTLSDHPNPDRALMLAIVREVIRILEHPHSARPEQAAPLHPNP